MKWRYRDIIDLEYFLHQDADSLSEGKQEELHERDRNIYLDSVVTGIGPDETPDRHTIIRTWLNRRREKENGMATVPPGESFASLYGSCRFIFFVAGLLLGGGAGASYLTYTGDRPVNVFVYFSVFVVLQLILLLLLFVFSLYRLRRRSFLSSSPLYMLIGRFMLRILLSARNHAAATLSADRRLQAEFALGTIVSKTRTYGFLFFLPIFILTQLFAIGFNLGLLGATLFKVITADIAFGWQSTIQMSPAAVSTLAEKIAMPWSWAVQGELAYPSLAQIEGSRIVLKEGIYHLATPDLVSWWPFLCFAVLVYGLLPRVVLLLGAAFAQRKKLAALDFRQGSCEQLLLRMTTPLVATRGRTVDKTAGRDRGASGGGYAETPPAAGGRIAGKNLLVMIPDEIFDSCSRQEIELLVNRGGVYDIKDFLRIHEEYAADRELLAGLRNSARMEESDILIIREAWQPPIMEYIDFIRQLRLALGDGPCIRIGLIGKPAADTVFTPVKDENREVWVRKVAAMGDPCIFTGEMVPDAS